MNTQSGTQWDGFRHVSYYTQLQEPLYFVGLIYCPSSPTLTASYSTTEYAPSSSISKFPSTKPNPNENQANSTDFLGPTANHRCSIHHWANHGIAGRGILLDYYHYAQTNNKSYDPYTTHKITLSELKACASSQGLDLRPQSQGGDIRIGDILLIRSGFVDKYGELSNEERYAAATRSHENLCFAGVAREPDMRDWLHDCYFAAVAGDSPTFEAWPVPNHDYLHQSMLALWGCPIGEMWDLERLAMLCRERGRWSFFVTSAPANMPGMFLLFL
jgi:hypothetical protein